MEDPKKRHPVKNEVSSVHVWDLPTRLVHWALVLLVANSLITVQFGGNAMPYHVYSGAAILALLLFRLIWGFIGSPAARFSHFVRGPRAVWRYARRLLGPESERHVGHNPMGGWSILAMLAALVLQAGTGLFATDDIATQGPLYPLVSDAAAGRLMAIHHFNGAVVLILVTLHVAAVFFYLLVKRENLITAMVTGRKQWQGPTEPLSGEGQAAWVAGVVAALCAAVVYLLFRSVQSV